MANATKSRIKESKVIEAAKQQEKQAIKAGATTFAATVETAVKFLTVKASNDANTSAHADIVGQRAGRLFFEGHLKTMKTTQEKVAKHISEESGKSISVRQIVMAIRHARINQLLDERGMPLMTVYTESDRFMLGYAQASGQKTATQWNEDPDDRLEQGLRILSDGIASGLDTTSAVTASLLALESKHETFKDLQNDGIEETASALKSEKKEKTAKTDAEREADVIKAIHRLLRTVEVPAERKAMSARIRAAVSEKGLAAAAKADKSAE